MLLKVLTSMLSLMLTNTAFDIKTGELFRATFPVKDPDMDIRTANNFVAEPVKVAFGIFYISL